MFDFINDQIKAIFGEDDTQGDVLAQEEFIERRRRITPTDVDDNDKELESLFEEAERIRKINYND